MMPQPTPTAPDFATLPKVYDWTTVLELYGGDEDRFLDDYCDGTLPLAIRKEVERSIDPARLTLWLLRRVVRLLGEDRA